VLAIAALNAGCGSDGSGSQTDAGEARSVVERFGSATARHDYQMICDELLADTLVKKVEDVGLPCEVAFEKGVGGVRNPKIDVRQVKVQGSRALVSVRSSATGEAPSDDAVQLVRQDGDWRIASLVSPSGQGTTTARTGTATGAAPTTVPTPDHNDRDDAAEAKRKAKTTKTTGD
jgi:hypothetical protein